jgi:hypothetical protein
MPNNALFRFFLCVLMSMLSLAIEAQGRNELTRPNWDRALALRSAAMGNNEQQRREWLEQLRQGEQDALLRSLKEFSASSTLSSPVREQQLLLFTLALADLSPELVPAELLDFLANYTPQTLVAHEESADRAVPLFNIPAAALGVQSAFTRQRAESHAVTLLTGPPEQLLQTFLDASPAERAGFLAALDFASSAQLSALNRSAQGLLNTQPGLTALAARTALAVADVESLRHVLEFGSGSDVTSMLRTAAKTFPPGDRADLLLSALESAPGGNAALAIALLSPGLQAVPQVVSTLFDLLDDAELGAAAALALSRIDSAEIRARLVQLGGSAGMAGARARLAVNLGEAEPRQGTPP